MKINELNGYLQSLPEKILPEVADIVAKTAWEYYRNTFSIKSFDGKPWEKAKVPKITGSLLVESTHLMRSVKPTFVSKDRVVISAGDDKAPYAKVHNEGFYGAVDVEEHARRGAKKRVKKHVRQMAIPKRQFLGNSAELNEKIHNRIEKYIESLLQ